MIYHWRKRWEGKRQKRENAPCPLFTRWTDGRKEMEDVESAKWSDFSVQMRVITGWGSKLSKTGTITRIWEIPVKLVMCEKGADGGVNKNSPISQSGLCVQSQHGESTQRKELFQHVNSITFYHSPIYQHKNTIKRRVVFIYLWKMQGELINFFCHFVVRDHRLHH